jgi:putative ABC transport system permease protein
MLLKHPSFSVVSILTLALGIGAVSAVFSVVYSLLWRPLPFHDPGRLVSLSESSKTHELMSVSYPNFMDWRDDNQVFDYVAAHRPTSFNLTGTDQPERLVGAQVYQSESGLIGECG